MEEVKTEDGSVTFYNEQYDDIYHSKSGAIEESFEKFIKPGLSEMFSEEPEVIRILDVCFGMGYNSAAAIDFISETYPNTRIEIVALEIDPEILSKVLLVKPDFKNYNLIQKAYENDLFCEEGNVSIRILQDDARVSVKNLEKEFDLCFHDAFSPSKHKEMWSEELFADIFKVMRKGGRLMTYSCARWVRDNLKNAGFDVSDGPRVGRRAPSTIALKP